jgi:hypothetical protein
MSACKKIFIFVYVFTLAFPSVFTHAEILISPKDSENQDAIVFSIQKGEEITREITLKNISNEDANVALEIGDLVQLDGGAVTTRKPDASSKGLAKNVSLEIKNLAIASLKSIDVPIKITIPNDVESGEYGLGITISQTQKPDEKSAINNVISRGLKIYIFVEGVEKKLDVNTQNLRINDNRSIEFQAKNTGSIFSKMVGTYTLQLKNAEQKQGNFQRDIISNESKQFLVSLPKDFYGEGKLNIEYSIVPLTRNGEEASKTETKNISLQYSQKQGEHNSEKQNIFQSFWIQIICGIISLSILGFVLWKKFI